MQDPSRCSARESERHERLTKHAPSTRNSGLSVPSPSGSARCQQGSHGEPSQPLRPRAEGGLRLQDLAQRAAPPRPRAGPAWPRPPRRKATAEMHDCTKSGAGLHGLGINCAVAPPGTARQSSARWLGYGATPGRVALRRATGLDNNKGRPPYIPLGALALQGDVEYGLRLEAARQGVQTPRPAKHRRTLAPQDNPRALHRAQGQPSPRGAAILFR